MAVAQHQPKNGVPCHFTEGGTAAPLAFAPRSRQITTPIPHHSVFTGRMPFLPPNQCYSSQLQLNSGDYRPVKRWDKPAVNCHREVHLLRTMATMKQPANRTTAVSRHARSIASSWLSAAATLSLDLASLTSATNCCCWAAHKHPHTVYGMLCLQ